jgi:hypothetical protein
MHGDTDKASGRATTVPAGGLMNTAAETVGDRLARIEALLISLVERESVKDWYTTAEFARLVGKAEFTIREYCRLGRLNAEKRMSGRGAFPAWVVAHAELLRYRREGLRPLRRG